MPEHYGLGAMPAGNMDQQIAQMAQSDPSQAAMMFQGMLQQAGIDMNQPLVKTLMQYVATGGMPASVAMQKLGR